MSKQNILAIVKKELRGYIVNPTTYIIAGVFLAVWEFLFFQSVFVAGQTSLQMMFNILPWFFLLLIPAITMGSIAEETSKETLELLLTHPLRDIDLIIGKYLSALAFVAVLLLATFPIALSLNAFGDLDFGVYFGQLAASFLLASALSALGIATSSFFKNQVPALMVSVVVIFMFLIMGTEVVTMSLPSILGGMFSRLSVLPHFESLARGVLDIRDIWYFLLLTAIFLELGYIKLLTRRSNRTSKKVLRERTIAFGLAGLLLFTSGFAFFPRLRLDLTQGNIYTLSGATKDILGNLPETVTITFYSSGNLPAQLQPLLTNVKDVLQDYKTYGGSHLAIEYKDPDGNESIAKEAQDAGVRPAQFNLMSGGDLQMKQAYFGLAVKTKAGEKSIPLIQNADNLEYQLTSFIRELTTKSKKKLGFLVFEDKTFAGTFKQLSDELAKQFDIQDIRLSKSTTTIPDDIDALIVAGPTRMFNDLYGNAVDQYLAEGKNALFMMDGFIANTQYLMGVKGSTSTNDVLGKYGVTVNNDMVYDLRANQIIQVGGNNTTYLIPYPPYVQAGVAKDAITGSKIQNVNIPWGSSITTDDKLIESKNLSLIPLITTTEYGGSMKDDFIIDPQKQFPQSDLSPRTIGVILKPKIENAKGKPALPRIMVISDSDFLTDSYIGGQNPNGPFGMEIVSYMAQEASLAGIKAKENTNHPLILKDSSMASKIKYGNMLGILILLAASGAIIIGRRRALRTMTYKEGKNM